MKKIYTAPRVRVVVVDDLCSNVGLQNASVMQGSLKGKQVDQFKVVEEEQTKTDAQYSTLWGNSNKENWGDD